MSKTQNFEGGSAPRGRAPFDAPRRSPADADLPRLSLAEADILRRTSTAAGVPRQRSAATEVPSAISLAEIAAAFENTTPPSEFPIPRSEFRAPRSDASFAPCERVTLRSLRHRLHVRAQEILTAAANLLITPQWCHDAPTGCVIATVTLPEAEKIAELILFPNGEAADPNHQPSTLNPQLRLKLPGRLYIIQLDPKEKPLRVKIGFTTNLKKRLRAFRCIAPDARYFAHWPAEDFWEKTATASITVNCRHLGGEVYEAQSLEDLRTRAEAFLALLPKPPTTPRFIPVIPRSPLQARIVHTGLPLPLPHHLHLPQAAQPPQPTTREDAHYFVGRRLRASVFGKALGGAEAPPSPNFRRGKAEGGAEPDVARPVTVETPPAPQSHPPPVPSTATARFPVYCSPQAATFPVPLFMASSIIPIDRLERIEFSNDEIARYSRHLIMPEVTLEGQKRLKAASILCIGAGGLGSPIALYLAAAGVGRIGLVDGDTVDFSNLQRQILHGTKDVGRKKLNSARDRLREVNPNVQVDLHDTFFTAANARQLAEPYDIIVDGTDNFPTRYCSNDVSVLLKKPNVYGSIFRFDGQCTVFAPHLGGPCYRCMFPEPPPPGMVPSCAEGGVLGVLPGIIGVMQAIEAVKLIMGIGDPLIGRLMQFDALKMKFKEFKLRRDPKCPVCGDNPTITELIDYEQFCGIPQAKAAEEEEAHVPAITAPELKAKFDRKDDFVLLDVREPFEYDICRIPGSRLIPLGQLPSRMSELDSADEIVLQCKSGVRSARALKLLQEAGFAKLSNLEGGIMAWSDEVDPSVPKY